MKRLIPVFFLLSWVAIDQARAGGVRGFIRNEAGQPLEFATIFVRENGSGTTANAEGFYQLRLDPGEYTLVFQYLGYRTEIQQVAIGERFRDLNVVLKPQVLELKTVEVVEGREDPAYTVMRKAIAKASYHRQQLDGYQAQVYIKGSGRLIKSPFFLRKMLREEGIDSTVAFTSESVSIIEYKRPNTFRERVISVYTTGEDNDTSPNSFINGSFYEPEIAEAISPLSPKAFAYYRFELAGYFVDRGYGVNQIRVIPRSRGENVFEGTIYIIENLWSIHSLSLKTYKFGIGFLVNQIYAPIQENVWLPVTHKFDVEGKILGFAFEYDYLATVSDYRIELNPDLDVDFQVIDEKLDRELAREIEQQKKENPKTGTIQEKLSAGEELTRKDLRKLIRDYEKEEQQEQKEPEVVINREYKVDSLAGKRDSTYWAAIRPIPLTLYEVRGYAREDSLRQVQKMEEEQGQAPDSTQVIKRKNRGKRGAFTPGDMLFGNSWKLADKQYLVYESPLQHINFNPVEGFNVNTDITYSNTRKNAFSLTFTPRYAFAREKFSGKGAVKYSAGPKDKRAVFGLEGGRYIFQYNPERPISEVINSVTTLFYERNYLRLYEKDYARFYFDKTLRENLSFRGGVEWARRYSLENNTSQTWFNRDDRSYISNIPYNLEMDFPFPAREDALFFNLSVETRPWQKYRIYNGKKSPIENSSPLLTFHYRKGLPGLLGSEINFDLVDLTVQHKFRIGARGIVDFKLNTGLFLNNERVGFPDFKHFDGNRIALVTADPVGSFRLLNYYRYSTQDKFAAVHLHYQFRKLLFTQIPEIWLMGIKENVFVNYLATPASQNYMEWGYSVDNIFRFLRLEAAVSFRDGRYQDWGVLIGIASNLGFFQFE